MVQLDGHASVELNLNVPNRRQYLTSECRSVMTYLVVESLTRRILISPLGLKTP